MFGFTSCVEQRRRLWVVQRHLLDVQFVAHLIGEPLDRPAVAVARRLHHQFGQRLTHLDFRRRSAPPSPATPDATERPCPSDSRSSISVCPPPGNRTGGRSPARPRRLQVLVHRLRQERHDRREQLRQRRQHGVQRLVGGQLVGALFALPEAPACCGGRTSCSACRPRTAPPPGRTSSRRSSRTPSAPTCTSFCRSDRIQRSRSGRSFTGTAGADGSKPSSRA